jgi:hypothetical protein
MKIATKRPSVNTVPLNRVITVVSIARQCIRKHVPIRNNRNCVFCVVRAARVIDGMAWVAEISAVVIGELSQQSKVTEKKWQEK